MNGENVVSVDGGDLDGVQSLRDGELLDLLLESDGVQSSGVADELDIVFDKFRQLSRESSGVARAAE